VVILPGAQARGRVISASESGRLKGVAHLRLTLDEVQVGDEVYEVSTTAVSRYGRNHKKNNWLWIGGGAGGGALIGALAGGAKGAAIGGPVGAGAGLAGAAITGKRDVKFNAETRLTFKLAQPLSIELPQ
jgi:hypothetical protein